jgi:hypothetical protein
MAQKHRRGIQNGDPSEISFQDEHFAGDQRDTQSRERSLANLRPGGNPIILPLIDSLPMAAEGMRKKVGTISAGATSPRLQNTSGEPIPARTLTQLFLSTTTLQKIQTAADQLGTTRSAFVRAALNAAFARFKIT